MKKGTLVTVADTSVYKDQFKDAIGIVYERLDNLSGRNILVKFPDYAGTLHNGNGVVGIRLEADDYWWFHTYELEKIVIPSIELEELV